MIRFQILQAQLGPFFWPQVALGTVILGLAIGALLARIRLGRAPVGLRTVLTNLGEFSSMVGLLGTVVGVLLACNGSDGTNWGHIVQALSLAYATTVVGLLGSMVATGSATIIWDILGEGKAL